MIIKKKNYKKYILFACTILFLVSCAQDNSIQKKVRTQHPDWSRNATIYEVNIRQYTPEGTFNAFAEHLPRLKEMGIDILWLMPINPVGKLNRKGSLGSYYSVQDYESVNPEFGTLNDFKSLVNKIHEMGMYVIVDWVANHTSWDNLWTETHPEFFSKDSLGNFYPPVEDWSDVIDLNYDSELMRNYMINAMKYWIEECNIDGYRCDVASMVPTDFWEKTRAELDKIKSVFMLAESDDNQLHKEAFDMTYNWPLKDLMNAVAIGEKNASDIRAYYNNEKTDFDVDDYRMTFTSNHDENSWHGTVFERLGNSVATFAVLTSVVKGMPLVYSGQEAGLSKSLLFFEKDQIDWQEHEFYNLYKTLFTLKENNKALWNGSSGGEMEFISSGNKTDILAFSREKNEDKIIAVFNLANSDKSVTLTGAVLDGKYHDLFGNTDISFSSSTADLDIPPWGYKIFVKK